MVSRELDAAPRAGIRRGWGSLTVAKVAGQSAVVSAVASQPLKLLIPRPRGPSVWAYLSSFGGGLVAGDETRLVVSVERDARFFLSTQASTKVYRNPAGLPCGHTLEARLGEGSMLVFAPDPVQAFAGSRYRHHQSFHVESGASLVLVDWLSSGRAARGERWAFQQYQSRNDVFLNGRRLLADSLLLDPIDGPLDGPYRMGRFNCLALLLLLGPAVKSAAERIREEVSKSPVGRNASLIQGASLLADGVLLRIAAPSTEDAGREIRRHLNCLQDHLCDNPWERKW